MCACRFQFSAPLLESSDLSNFAIDSDWTDLMFSSPDADDWATHFRMAMPETCSMPSYNMSGVCRMAYTGLSTLMRLPVSVRGVARQYWVVSPKQPQHTPVDPHLLPCRRSVVPTPPHANHTMDTLCKTTTLLYISPRHRPTQLQDPHTRLRESRAVGLAVWTPVSSRHTHVPLRLPNCMHPHVLFLCAWQLLVEIKKNLRYADSPPAMALAVSGALTAMLSSPTPCISNADCSSGLTCVDLAGPQVCVGEVCVT